MGWAQLNADRKATEGLTKFQCPQNNDVIYFSATFSKVKHVLSAEM